MFEVALVSTLAFCGYMAMCMVVVIRSRPGATFCGPVGLSRRAAVLLSALAIIGSLLVLAVAWSK